MEACIRYIMKGKESKTIRGRRGNMTFLREGGRGHPRSFAIPARKLTPHETLKLKPIASDRKLDGEA